MPPDREMLVCAAAIAICILSMKLVGDNAEFIDGKLAPYFVKPAWYDDIEIDLVQHVEQYEDPPPQPNPQPPPPNPLLPIQPAPKVQMPYAELYAHHPRATEIMTTLWLLEFIMDLCLVDTCTLFQEPIRLSHLLHAGIRTLFMLGKSPTFLSWYPDAARRLHMPDAAAILNAAAVGCQLFLPLYLLAVARARAARSDRIGWVAIMQSVCSHVVGIGFLYHQAFHPKNWAGQIASDPATVLKLVALGGTWWSVILYLWAAFKAAAFLAVEYNSLKMRVAASRRGDSGLTTAERMAIHEQLQLHPLVIGIYVLSLLLQAVLCVVAFHAPKIFRRHFLKTQGSFLFSEWLAWIAMKAIHPTMISCWRSEEDMHDDLLDPILAAHNARMRQQLAVARRQLEEARRQGRFFPFDDQRLQRARDGQTTIAGLQQAIDEFGRVLEEARQEGILRQRLANTAQQAPAARTETQQAAVARVVNEGLAGSMEGSKAARAA